MRRRHFAVLSAVVMALSLPAAPAAAVDSPTYGYGNSRDGSSGRPVGISASAAPHLHATWRDALDGWIEGQPIVVNGVRFKHHRRDLVLVGTEHGEVAAIQVGGGRVLWTRHLGSHGYGRGCSGASADGRFGITGTMVADPDAGRVYAVDLIGRLWALSLRTGRTIKGWPVYVYSPRSSDFDYGALTLSRGWIYVPVSSLCDTGRYYGGVRAVSVRDPREHRNWLTTAGTSAYGGAIWGWGGLSVDERTGDLFGATGNSLGTADEAAGYAEQVVRLSPLLHVLQHNYPLEGPFSLNDRDFGTVPVLMRRPGCPEQAVAINKDGWLYRYDVGRISAGPRQWIKVASTTSRTIPLYGMPAYDPGTHRLVLTSPTAGPNGRRKGIQSYVLDRHCRLTYGWQHGFDNPSAGSAPTIAQGVLYLGTGRNGIIRAYRLSDGRELWSHTLGPTIFAAPIAADGVLFAADWGGNLWAFRP